MHTEKNTNKQKQVSLLHVPVLSLLEFYKQREGSLLISTTTHDLYHFKTEVCF